ncbi:MAG TPA: hypothetical protein V6C81_18870 [Planktothrix sp.]
MTDPAKSDLDVLARRLSAVAAELTEVNERLEDVESDLHEEMHRSTVFLAHRKRDASKAQPEHKMYNPLAGP